MRFEERVILGEGKSFMTVRHLVLHGTNYEIGQKLAEIATERHDLSAKTIGGADPIVTRSRRRFLLRNYPTFLQRAEGAAHALKVDLADDRFDSTELWYNLDIPATASPPGCSTVYYPPHTTASGHGILSRNYDFPKGTPADMLGIPLSPEQRRTLRPMMADPYVTETYPMDGGYSSLCLVCFDLLSGVLEGINSEGLVAALNADELVAAERGVEDIRQTVGLHELQALCLVLDTCATVEEAKEALLTNKQRYALVPCHFTIGDRRGDSFVYDHGHGRRREHLIDGSGEPLFVTNHPLHLYPSFADFPEKWRIADARTTSFERYKRLAEMIEETPRPYTLNDIRDISAGVSVSQAASWIPDEHRPQFATHPASSRTLWHSIYDSDARTLEVKFYLDEQPAPNGNFTEHYSEYFHFALQR